MIAKKRFKIILTLAQRPGQASCINSHVSDDIDKCKQMLRENVYKQTNKQKTPTVNPR